MTTMLLPSQKHKTPFEKRLPWGEERRKWVQRRREGIDRGPIVPKWYSQKGWIVSTKQLAEFITDNEAKYRDAVMRTDYDRAVEEYGWLGEVAVQTAMLSKNTSEACRRRLYGVLKGETLSINAPFATAVVDVIGLDLDRDTDIAVLPGSLPDARDLVSIRAECYDVALTPLEVERHARTTVRLASLIVKHPRHASRLQDAAPFNCLRGY